MSLRFNIAFALCTALALSSIPASAQGFQEVVLTDESRIWIEGSSSVNTFDCVAETLKGSGGLSTGSEVGRKAEASISVPVLGFDCGKSRMNRDFAEALKADDHPEIRFELNDADATEPFSENGAGYLHVAGLLQIAGAQRHVTMVVHGQQRSDTTFRATGSLPLLMSDFGVDPPTALFGLIKAHDPITVHFDLVASTRTENQTF